jgi:hypothetical protein
MGIMMLGGPLAQNAVLARYPDSVHELAVFARGWGTFAFFNATLVFMPHVANVLARGPEARRVTGRFAVVTSAAIAASLALVAVTPTGRYLVGELYGISGETLTQVIRYLRWLWPLILVNGVRHYLTGLLVQARRTGVVTLLNVAQLAVLATLLAVGLAGGWSALTTVVSAQLVSATASLIVLIALVPRMAPEDGVPGDPSPITTRKVLAFFWPVALTSGLFAFSRPILYSFAGRTPDGEVLIAALKIAFDVSMLFHIPLNQFRHVFATYGRTDLPALRRFLIIVTGGTTLVAIGLLVSGLVRLGIARGIGASKEVLPGAVEATWVLAAIPLVVGLRNYHHGLSLADRHTTPMALGSVLRNLAIFGAGWGFYAAGRLGFATGAAALLIGFLVEAIAVALTPQSRAEPKPTRDMLAR